MNGTGGNGVIAAADGHEKVYDVRMTGGAKGNYRFGCRADEPLVAGIRRAFCEEMPRGCSGGGCGVCKIVVNSGDVRAFKPMSRAHVSEDEITRNVVLACCVNPRSDLVISLFAAYENEDKNKQPSCS
jgi:ferredoxin